MWTVIHKRRFVLCLLCLFNRKDECELRLANSSSWILNNFRWDYNQNFSSLVLFLRRYFQVRIGDKTKLNLLCKQCFWWCRNISLLAFQAGITMAIMSVLTSKKVLRDYILEILTCCDCSAPSLPRNVVLVINKIPLINNTG